MVFDFDFSDLTWIIGLGVAFGFGFVVSYLIEGGLFGFIIFFSIMIGFVVWAGLLDLWILIVCLIVDVIFVYLKFGRGVEF